MAIDRTLEELKLILALSRASETGLLNKLLPQAGTDFFPSEATRKLGNDATKYYPKPAADPSRGILGHGSINDLMKANPEFRENYEKAEAKDTKASKKIDTLRQSSDVKESKRNPFVKHRRKIVSDQLKGLRNNPQMPAGPGRLAAKFEILRLLRDRPEHAHNPLKTLGGYMRDTEQSKYMNEHQFEYVEHFDPDNPADQKEALKEIESNRQKRRKQLSESTLKQTSQFTPYKLRRMTDADLDFLLSSGYKDPKILGPLMEEKARRVRDLYNQNQSRRNVLKRGVAGAVKPALPKGVTGVGGSTGEKVAKTFLRLLTRGKGL